MLEQIAKCDNEKCGHTKQESNGWWMVAKEGTGDGLQVTVEHYQQARAGGKLTFCSIPCLQAKFGQWLDEYDGKQWTVDSGQKADDIPPALAHRTDATTRAGEGPPPLPGRAGESKGRDSGHGTRDSGIGKLSLMVLIVVMGWALVQIAGAEGQSSVIPDFRPRFIGAIGVQKSDSHQYSVTTPSPGSRAPSPESRVPGSHHFWDTQNVSLTIAGGALRAGDIWSTKRFLARGGHEAVLPESWVRSDAKFFAYHAIGQTVFTLAAWGFHRTRHHRLERAVLWIQAGATAGFVVNNVAYASRLQVTGYR